MLCTVCVVACETEAYDIVSRLMEDGLDLPSVALVIPDGSRNVRPVRDGVTHVGCVGLAHQLLGSGHDKTVRQSCEDHLKEGRVVVLVRTQNVEQQRRAGHILADCNATEICTTEGVLDPRTAP